MARCKQMMTAGIITIMIFGMVGSGWTAQAAPPLSVQQPDQIAASINPLNDTAYAASLELSPRASQQQVEFEVVVPWESLVLETVEMDGQAFVRVTLPGWAQTVEAGKPALPLQLEQLGVPVDAAVSIEVSPGMTHTYMLEAPVLPVVTQSVEYIYQESSDESEPFVTEKNFVYEMDPSAYSGGVYPGLLADITGDSIMRQQRIVSIGAFPVQYDAAKQELTVFESLRVVVSFESAQSVSGAQGSTESAAFEELLAGELLNYDAAREYRAAEMPLTPEAELLIPDEGWVTPLEGVSGASLPWTPPSPGYRVKVRADGMYQLTYAELQAKGLPVATLDPHSFQLFNLGEEVKIRVTGENDGKFDANDLIIFYGKALSSKYTWDNVYWLTYGNTAQGQRMAERDGTPGGATTPTTYTAYRHYEGYDAYFTQAPGDAELDRWMWRYMYAYSIHTPSNPLIWNTPIVIPTYASGAAVMRIAMVGNTSYGLVSPDHHARVYVNGTEVGNLTWDGRTWLPLQDLAVPAGVLVAGSNTVEVRLPRDISGVGTDGIYIDWIELDFSNNFTAENNELAFKYSSAGAWKFQAGGFTTNLLGVYDVSSAAAPVLITGAVVTPAPSPYTVTFQDTSTTSSKYWTGAPKTVQAIEADTPSNLQSTANGADHIVITHQAFASAAAALSSYRAAQMRALVVDVQDIYDEFNYGIVHPAPIHDFLAYTYASWQSPAPSYVVLMGDGHSDPKNYVTTYGNRVSYIPPYLMPIDPGKLETAADNRYVTIVGTDIMPDMMLGRFAVNDVAEANVMVNKVTTYEGLQAGGWQQQVLAVADNWDSAGNFPLYSDNLLAAELPASYTPTKVYLPTGATPTQISATKAAIVAGFGKLLVNYIGHGFTGGWAGEVIFRTNDVATLSNGNNMPVVLSMDCNDGYFINSYAYSYNIEALAEVLTRVSGKGAVASWSPSGEGVASGHDYLNRGFFRALFTNGVDTVGEATMVGKLTLGGFAPDLLDTYLLFGDPALDMPTVAVANDAPVITGQVGTLSTNEDTPLTLTLANLTVTDPDLPPYPTGFTLTALSGSNYSVAGTAITPAANYFGSLTVPVRVNDGMLNSNIYNLTVSVTAVNDAPVAVEDFYTTPGNTPLILTGSQIKANDTDVDNTNAQLSLISVGSATNGSVTKVGDTVTFTPTPGFMGIAGFNYMISDGQASASGGHVTVDVSEPKTPQTITVVTHAPASKVYGTTFSVAATASSGLTVTYSSGNPSVCTNSGAVFTMVNGTGVCPVQYDQAGNGIYAPAPRVTENVNAQKASQAISITTHAPATSTIGATFNVAATASSGLEVVYSSGNPTVCTVISSAYSIIAETGTCVVQYDQSGSSNYLPAAQLVDYVEVLTSHSIALVTGWNLVSFNLVPATTAIADVLDSIDGKYDLVYAWDATGVSSGAGNWKMYDPDVLISQTLTVLTNGMGFWVHMTEAGTLTVTGTTPTTTNVSLLTNAGGWNLVGYPSAGSEALPGALTNHGVGSAGYSLVYAYHAAEADYWKMFDPTAAPYANDLTSLDPGWGFWIKVNTPATWGIDY